MTRYCQHSMGVPTYFMGLSCLNSDAQRIHTVTWFAREHRQKNNLLLEKKIGFGSKCSSNAASRSALQEPELLTLRLLGSPIPTWLWVKTNGTKLGQVTTDFRTNVNRDWEVFGVPFVYKSFGGDPSSHVLICPELWSLILARLKAKLLLTLPGKPP